MFYYLHYFVAIGWHWRLIFTVNSYTQSQVHSFVHTETYSGVYLYKSSKHLRHILRACGGTYKPIMTKFCTGR